MKKLADSGKAGEKLIEKEKVETGKVNLLIKISFYKNAMNLW